MGRKRMTTMGKQKIEMKKLENIDARNVCFSKRKLGMFIKAGELATLCGAEVAIVVYSLAGCPYSFGSPATNTVIDRFLSGGLFHSDLSTLEPCSLNTIQGLNNQFMELSRQLDSAKKRKAMLEERLDKLSEENQLAQTAENIDVLSLLQLRELEKSLCEFKGVLKICKHVAEGSSSDRVIQIMEPNLFGSESERMNPSGMMKLKVFIGHQDGRHVNKASPVMQGDSVAIDPVDHGLEQSAHRSNMVNLNEVRAKEPGPCGEGFTK